MCQTKKSLDFRYAKNIQKNLFWKDKKSQKSKRNEVLVEKLKI